MDPEWIERALNEGGVAHLRKRKLAVEDVVWLVIGMALYRNESMEKVVHRLDLVLPKKDGHAGVVRKGGDPPGAADQFFGCPAIDAGFFLLAGRRP